VFNVVIMLVQKYESALQINAHLSET